MTGLRLARKVDSQATMNGRIPGQYCFLLDQVCTNHVSNQASKPDISYKYGILIDPLLWSHTFSKRRLANAPSYLKRSTDCRVEDSFPKSPKYASGPRRFENCNLSC